MITDENKENWIEIENYIRNTLNEVSSYIDDESNKHVLHYLNCSEYEMAFEGLFIEIMKSNIQVDFNLATIVAKQLHLDKESVFNPLFWNEFENYSTPK